MMHIGWLVWRVGNSILDKAQAAIAAAGRAAGASGMMSTSSIKTAPLFWPYLRKLTVDSGNPVLTPRLYCCAIVGTIGSSMITGTTAATPSQMAFIGGLDPVKQAENMIQVGSHTHTYPHPLTLTTSHKGNPH